MDEKKFEIFLRPNFEIMLSLIIIKIFSTALNQVN